MDRRCMPLILMLVAGAITCVITFIKSYSVFAKLTILLIVLLVFYFLGNVLKSTLDYFEIENEKKRKAEGEVIEKENSEAEPSENK